MLQAAVRAVPPGVVHDTVAAVMRTAPFRRSFGTSLLGRLYEWLMQGLEWLSRYVHGVPATRTIALWLTGALALAIAARLVYAARVRDPAAAARWSRGEVRRGEDPWRAAERLAAAGDYEGAAHALYRGVVTGIAEHERLRLDPSQTSGDFARALRARGSAAHAPFRAFARRFEAAIYGHGRVDATGFAELAALAAALRGTARAA